MSSEKDVELALMPQVEQKNGQPIPDNYKLAYDFNILMSIEDVSMIISNYLSNNETEDFWTENRVQNINDFYINNPEADIKNLLSILMHDWHDYNKNSPKIYYLEKKFGAKRSQVEAEEFQGSKYENFKLLERLFKAFDDKSQESVHYYCLKIIYFFFDEQQVDFSYDNVKEMINYALAINNIQYRTEILKILMIFIKNVRNEHYYHMKKQIMQAVKFNFIETSVCKSSFKKMKNHCDEKFFELAFFLKENQIMNFKVEYIEYITMHKRFFGEFWTFALRLNAQLFYTITSQQQLIELKEFISLNTNDSELKKPIINMYKNHAEFYCVFRKSLTQDETTLMKQLEELSSNLWYTNPQQLKKILCNTPEIRRLLFGRRDFYRKSIFEEFLSKPYPNQENDDSSKNTEDANKNKELCIDLDYVFNHIWNEFLLIENPEILIQKNPLQKTIFQYVMERENDSDLISLLMIEKSETYTDLCKTMHYMILKNSLYYDHKKDPNDKCLIDFHLKLIDMNDGYDYENFKNILYLFEEISQYSQEQLEINQTINEIYRKISAEQPDEFDGENDLKLPRKHFLMGLIMTYWKYDIEKSELSPQIEFKSADHEHTKRSFFTFRSLSNAVIMNPSLRRDVSKEKCEITPFFKLLLLILEKDHAKFIAEFPQEVKNMENSYKIFYKLDREYDNRHQQQTKSIFNFYEKYTTNFSFILLYAAIKTKQKSIIEKIFELNNFVICIPEYPSNMKVEEIHNFTALKFLENKYELGRNDLPANWFPRKVMKGFLDSRISDEEGFYKIDCKFMLPFYCYDDMPEKLNDDLRFNEDYDTMKYIVQSHDLKSLVTHPVMESIIRVKIQKYSQVAFLNLIMFIVFYMLPTTALVYLFHPGLLSKNEESTNSTESTDDINETPSKHSSVQLSYVCIYILILIRLPFMMIREYSQYQIISSGCIKKYFKSHSNKLEFSLILLPIIVLMVTIAHHVLPQQQASIYIILVSFEALNVFLMIIATVFLLPVLKFKILMNCFKKVLSTYLYIFAAFLPIFIGCVTLTFIIFDKNFGGEMDEFQGFGNALMKYIIMYSGELGVSPDKLSGFIQGAVITIIIILIINKFNLIISIVVNDVQKIMDQSKEYNLVIQAEKYVEFAETLRTFFAVHIEGKDRNKINWRYLWFYKLAKWHLKKIPNSQRLQMIYIDKKSKKIYVDNKKSEHSNIFERFMLDKETMDEIHDIVEQRNEI